LEELYYLFGRTLLPFWKNSITFLEELYYLYSPEAA